MKRNIFIPAVCALLLAGLPISAEALQWEVRDVTHTYTVSPGRSGFMKDGEEIKLPEGLEIYRKDGYLMVPLRAFLETLREKTVSEDWEDSTGEAWFYWGEGLLGIDTKNGTARLTGTETPLDVIAERRGEWLFISLRSWKDILSASGYIMADGTPGWDSRTQTATLAFSGQELVFSGEETPVPAGEGAAPEYVLEPTQGYSMISALGGGYFSAERTGGGTEVLDSTGAVRQSYGRGFDVEYLGEERFRVTDFNSKKAKVVDADGKEVFQAGFHKTIRIGFYSEGLAAWRDETGNTGFIDIWGNPVIPARYTDAEPFSDGLALVGRQGQYIDKTGKTVIDAGYDLCYPFREGLAAVRTKEGKWGYIDRAGQEVIPPRYDWAGDFYHGRAFVLEGRGTENEKLWSIDKTGKGKRLAAEDDHFCPPSFDTRARGVMASETVVVYTGGHAHLGSFYSADGEISYEKAQMIRSSGDGLAAFRDEASGKWGYVDGNWNWAVAPAFDSAEPFEAGCAVVRMDVKQGNARIGSAYGIIRKP